MPPQYDEAQRQRRRHDQAERPPNQDQKIAAITTATGESPVECHKP